jgi:hypothetical protein
MPQMMVALQHFFVALPAKLREEDKIQHMVLSFCLMLAALIVFPATLAFTLVFLVGLVKEFWDARFGSGFCLFDMAGNLIGSSVCLIVWLVLVPGSLT